MEDKSVQIGKGIGSLARFVTMVAANVSASGVSAKEQAESLRIVQIPFVPVIYPKKPSGKPNIAQRRLARMRAK